jgi:hypothetical protein
MKIKNSLEKFLFKEEEKQITNILRLIDFESKQRIGKKSLIYLSNELENLKEEILKRNNINVNLKYKMFQKIIKRMIDKNESNIEYEYNFLYNNFKNIIDIEKKKIILLARY